MRTSIARPQAQVCQLCNFISTSRPAIRNPLLRNAARPLSTSRRLQKAAYAAPVPTKSKKLQNTEPIAPQNASVYITETSEVRSRSRKQIQDGVLRVSQKINSIVSQERIPQDDEVSTALEDCQMVADYLVEPPSQKEEKEGIAAAALLSVDGITTTRSPTKSTIHSSDVRLAMKKISELAEELIRHPTVFITPDILRRYVEIQSRLGKPNSFPEIFELYATKPIPKEGSSPIRYDTQNADNSSNAIPGPTADLALQTAIDAKELTAAMGIIEESWSVPAYRKAKFIRKALLPLTGFAVAPVAAYAVASQAAMYQSSMDTGMATNIAFAGIVAYMGFTSTIGFVALSTANDQMDRVTWAQGMPLRERWIREDERAAIDKIAGAWGFQETYRRGEEEGQDWETLREWIGRKGMILDKVELMEGME